ncbi:NACHT domain-containing NTPase [Streptomyces sp. XD-27]|uniref:NACHT domain-containing protein n=1 Tax=Streptomyces sp. XD-27 TaxID=3062779 RepID=UPI0026F4342B|nr:NACHT domain-containing protein [Streptomyces sp. XD-27]WKX70243.1 NACHT domain-containing protein [Streptomyces sp. XD-27]
MAEGRAGALLAKVGLAAASVVPPALLGARFWPSVREHPVGALLLFLAYLVLLAAVGFCVKVYTNVADRWVTRAADGVDRRLRWRISRFERDYRAYVLSHHRFIDLKGLATRGDFTPGLEEVFVDVSLVPTPTHTASQESLAGTVRAAGAAVRQSIHDFLGTPDGTALAVIGAPGTGKTTLLKHLALRLAREPGKRGSRDLPILLFLRDHAAAITADPEITLPEVIGASLRRLRGDEPPGWFDRQLQAGRCVVLLDGLDEVAREEDRRNVSKWVEEQIESYEANDFVLTSRPHGYRSAPVNRARVLQVRRFTGEQITRFVQGWYRAIERLSTGADDAAVADRAAEEATDLLDRLRARPVLYDLAANPLLLTMIANVHRYRGALPGSRAELYAEICEVLLWRRQEAKGNVAALPDELTGAKKEAVLRELAYVMMCERRRDIDTARAAETLGPALFRVGAAAVPVEDFLAAIVASGLLVERERGMYAFAHLTLQEHLAALHIQYRGLVDTLIAGVQDDWWRETTLLYAARVDPGPIVEACVDSGSVTAIALAFDCEEEAAEFAPETRRLLEDLRTDALRTGPDMPMGRLMTAVTVTRALRQTVRLGQDTLVCASPVSEELYGLFTGEPRAGHRTATGMTGREAAAFTQWVNELLPDGPRYRLPTEAEVADEGFRMVAADRPVWYAPDAQTRLWVPEGTEHPWSVPMDPEGQVWLGQDDEADRVLELGKLGLAVVRGFANSSGLAADPPRRRVGVTRGSGVSVGSQARHDAQAARAGALILSLGLDTALVRDIVLAPERAWERAGATHPSPGLSRHGNPARVLEFIRPLAPSLPPKAHVDQLAEATRLVALLLIVAAREDSTVAGLLRAVSFPDRLARPAGETQPVSTRIAPDPGEEGVAASVAAGFLWNAANTTRDLEDMSANLPAALSQLTGRLIDELRPPEAPDPAEAPYLRLTALTLAAVADRLLHAPEAAEAYRHTVRGVMARCGRADGTMPKPETIVLVRA